MRLDFRVRRLRTRWNPPDRPWDDVYARSEPLLTLVTANLRAYVQGRPEQEPDTTAPEGRFAAAWYRQYERSRDQTTSKVMRGAIERLTEEELVFLSEGGEPPMNRTGAEP